MSNNQSFNSSGGVFTGMGGMAQPEIEAKNLGILQDQMHHEALAYKKCMIYSGYFTEQPLKDLSYNAAQHHKRHFDSLQNYLNSHK